MLDLALLVDELWRGGVGPDDRPRIHAASAKLAEAADIAHVTPATRGELACFQALVDLMLGTRVPAPPAIREGRPSTRTLAAITAVWAAVVARDFDKIESQLASLEHHLGTLVEDDPRTPIAQAWADLALAEAALAAADRSTARHRFESVARGAAPIPLRIAATLRVVTLLLERADVEQARSRCRQAAALADSAERAMHAHHARVTGALIDFMSGDRAEARRTLRAEADKGPLGLLPRVLLSSFEPPERALPLLAEGLRDAAERADPFAFTMCTLVGARRYAALDRDGDALLVLTTAIHQLKPHAPDFAKTLDDERSALRNDWGAERYAAAEQAAIALLDEGRT